MEVEREKLRLRSSKRISPPIVVEPLYGCATAVLVSGFVPDATLDVELDGAIVVSGHAISAPTALGELVDLSTALTPGQVVRARQRAVVTSGWSSPVTVRDHRADYPAGPPRPQIEPAPVYRCGSRTGVANLLTGCNVWITADALEVGRVDGAAPHQGVNVNPDYGAGQSVIAWAELCGDPSSPSQTHVTQDPPLPLPTPSFEPAYAGSTTVTLNGLSNGARFTLSRNGVAIGTYRAWGGRFTVWGVSPVVVGGDVFSASQTLCPGDGPSPPGTITVLPCSALPAPGVMAPQAGDTTITLTYFVPDARITVYVNGAERGDGGGPVLALMSPLRSGDTIDVVQRVGSCTSMWAQELVVACVAPPARETPAALDLFPVGASEYSGGTTSILGMTMHVRGSVYYPAQSDGDGTPFNGRLAELGPVPIVFIVHGRHDPSVPNYQGYDYFQQQLARIGIVAVSVDENETFPRHGASNIRERADLAIASLAHFQSLNAGGDARFAGRIDFTRVGLMGHSRGGEAVVVVPELPLPAGVDIRSVLSLAPVDFGASSGHPSGRAFMTILPAADGDVTRNPGAHFYDQATPSPYRSQLYVDHANHNYFNRVWTNDDAQGRLPLMSRADHERILSAYGCSLFRNTLLAHDTVGFIEGRVRPVDVIMDSVHLSFQPQRTEIVDHHEDGNGIAVNSFGAPTAQSAGLSADEHPFDQVPAAFNGTFFGRSMGMVAISERVGGTFRSELDVPRNVTGREIRLRVAEVYAGRGPLPADATGFELGLETSGGTVLWEDSDDVGGVPRPFEREAFGPTKTMLTTLRFPASCFSTGRRLPRIRAILIRLNRGDQRALAFDDLEIV